MSLGSTILAVRAAHLALGQTDLSRLAQKVDMRENTVRNALAILMGLGLAEKIRHTPPIPGKKGGWIQVEWKPVVIDIKPIDRTAIDKED